MNELLYVLAVEALVFGALCTVVLAQRLDVFAWPADRSWPVLSSSLQALLLYAHVLVLLCCFLAAGRFASSLHLRDAFARSAGRVVTAAALGAVSVGVLLLAGETDSGAEDFLVHGAGTDCVLCQLLGTSCAQPAPLFWSASYAAFLAVLLPVAVLQAGLILKAAAMCKELRVAPRRLATANCALLIVAQVVESLTDNKAHLPAHCLVSQNTLELESLKTVHEAVWISLTALFVLDVFADVSASIVFACQVSENVAEDLKLANLGIQKIKSTVSAAAFTVAHLGTICLFWLPVSQLKIVFLFDVAADLASRRAWWTAGAHTALAVVLAGLDIADVCLQHRANVKHLSKLQKQTWDQGVPQGVPQSEVVLNAAEPSKPGFKQRAPFQVDPARRRFMLTFGNKARWMPKLPQHADKKTT